jgi:putative aldouronate transport system substrate-binding protein
MGNPNKEQLKTLYMNEPNADEIADILDPYYKAYENYGKQVPLIDTPRPVSEKSIANITKFLYDALSKAIIAKDFDAEWEKVVSGWKKNGGEAYDAEVTESLVQMNWKTTNE